MDLKEMLLLAVHASFRAGEEILKVYGTRFEVESKEDRSPLTLADKNSHKVIFEALSRTGIPVLSEEGKSIPYQERRSWDRLWIVDPLDGTKEFIKRNGEFTVNIALVEKGAAILGVIYVPVKKVLYFAAKGIGSFKTAEGHAVSDFQGLLDVSVKLPAHQPAKNKFTVVASRSHADETTTRFIEELKRKHGEIEIVSTGSSLKMCLVAEGAADVYPRFGPTMEWDTAAGQAIAEYANGKFIDAGTGVSMVYNKPDLRNNFFVCSGASVLFPPAS